MTAYIPEECSKFALCADRCYTGSHPTLADLRAMHGQKWAILWLENQLRALSEFAGVKSKFTTEQLTAAAATIYAEAFYLKLPELMLFFHRFRAGYYEQFYGAADPMRVTAALLKFREERAAAIDRLQREATTRAIIHEDRSDAMTYDEWQSKQTTP